ncbi:anti-sigma factor [Jiella marina]|uniref:anti-sigma factor n=1 Tax=Jiella sp. LLJ827 TaxID=2917712 RepID=UPI002100824C|nr:anti-sigma factor [Jiella sp. LLJ827]MCQ0988446.1 anti-sigma factor [Jiella sp. LLJ827]
MSDQPHDDSEDAVLAAEYVLGVLDDSARLAVERRADRDPAFAAEIDAWGERLAPFFEAMPEETPPAALWPRIAADLARMRRFRHGTGREGRQRGGRRVAGIWQWIGLSGMGLAAASLGALILVAGGLGGQFGLTPDPAADRGTLIATLASEQGEPLFTISIDRASGTATLIPVGAPTGQGRVPELWMVPPGGGAPRSLGVIDASTAHRLSIVEAGIDMPETALAVSMEPPGGSPTGSPTGPVVASGPLHGI